jgi:hypothetical protein
MDIFEENKLLAGLKQFYASIPANSPVRTSIIKTIFKDCKAEFISDFLGIDTSSAYKVEFQWLPVPIN